MSEVYFGNRMRAAAITLLCCLAVEARGPVPLTRRIDAALRTADLGAHIGVLVVDGRSGRAVYARNAEKRFVPASTAKLFSTALALTRLGPEHRFATRATAAAGPDANGTLQGDLRLAGGADPDLPLSGLDEMAGQVGERGVRRITGDIVGDDTRWQWKPYPEGWAVDDAVAEYGAAVSALAVEGSSVRIALTAEGVDVEPAAPWLTLQNRARPGAETELEWRRLPGGREVVITGTVGPDGARARLAVPDPAEFAAAAFREALLRRGIAVEGGARAQHRTGSAAVAEQPGVVLAERAGTPVSELVRRVNQESLNLQAEMLLREAAFAEGISTAEASEKFLAGAGVEGVALRDGSGLSRLNLVTPAALVRLLEFMARSPYAAAWMESLAQPGLEGTMQGRLRGVRGAEALRAKTGTMTGVGGLAGYVVEGGRPRYVFAILVNGSTARSAETRATVDKIVTALLRRSR